MYYPKFDADFVFCLFRLTPSQIQVFRRKRAGLQTLFRWSLPHRPQCTNHILLDTSLRSIKPLVPPGKYYLKYIVFISVSTVDDLRLCRNVTDGYWKLLKDGKNKLCHHSSGARGGADGPGGSTPSYFCVRRVQNFRLTNSKCMVLVEQWKKLHHTNLVSLRQVFTSKVNHSTQLNMSWKPTL